MAETCIGCNHTFKNKTGLKNHAKDCPGRSKAVKQTLLDRNAQAARREEEAAAKIRKISEMQNIELERGQLRVELNEVSHHVNNM